MRFLAMTADLPCARAGAQWATKVLVLTARRWYLPGVMTTQSRIEHGRASLPASRALNDGPAGASPSSAVIAAGLVVVLLAAGAAIAEPMPVAVGPGSPHPELAKGKFLVASRSIRDPNFTRSVILIVDYDEAGALGVVVNHPTDVPLKAALPEIKELRKRKDRVHLGGPVARDRMVLLLRTKKAPPESVLIFDTVYASGSLDALREGVTGGNTVRAYAGYAGWGPGQLDAEVSRGDWLIGPADAKSIFDDPPERVWETLIERFTGDWARAPFRGRISPIAYR
jgi:putative transcriptional regulator